MAWCIHGWAEFLMHHHQMFDPSTVVDYCSVVTVIDVDEFEAAHDDPDWLAFCEDADAYLRSVFAV